MRQTANGSQQATRDKRQARCRWPRASEGQSVDGGDGASAGAVGVCGYVDVDVDASDTPLLS